MTIVGLLSGRLALSSDAIHNLSETIAIALSHFNIKIAGKPKDARRTYGYKRAGIFSAFINASIVLVKNWVRCKDTIEFFILWSNYIMTNIKGSNSTPL